MLESLPRGPRDGEREADRAVVLRRLSAPRMADRSEFDRMADKRALTCAQ